MSNGYKFLLPSFYEVSTPIPAQTIDDFTTDVFKSLLTPFKITMDAAAMTQITL